MSPLLFTNYGKMRRNPSNLDQRKIWVILFLISAVLILYWPVQFYSFNPLDDTVFITENGHVQDGFTLESLKWALTNTDIGFWKPVTWLSWMLDYRLFWLNAGGYHWTNLVFHIINTVLLFFVLKRMTGSVRRSGLVALLFGIHPLHVESVAWIAERKDVLSIFFLLLSLWAYDSYVKKRSVLAYLSVVVFFILGNMSKSMVMTLPFILLLLDYWPLKRLQLDADGNASGDSLTKGVSKLLIEKIPLFVIAAVFGILTYYAQDKLGAVIYEDAAAWYQNINIANPIVSYVRYIWKMLWPTELAVFYPPNAWSYGQVNLAALFLATLSMLAIRRIRKNPYLLVGWGWYLVSLVPVIGFIQVGLQSMADRYTYLPLTGLFIIVAWGGYDLIRLCSTSRVWRYSKILIASVSLISLSALYILGCVQVRYWKDNITLFEHAVQVTENNFFAYNCLGSSYAALSKKDPSALDKAVFYYRQAIKANPNFEHAYVNLGNVLGVKGDYEEANTALRMAIDVWDNSKARVNLGVNYFRMGKLDEAIKEFKVMIENDPTERSAYRNLGAALQAKGDTQGAIKAYQEAIKMKATPLPAIHNDLGLLLAQTNNRSQAVYHIREALRIKPDFEPALHNLNVVLNK